MRTTILVLLTVLVIVVAKGPKPKPPNPNKHRIGVLPDKFQRDNNDSARPVEVAGRTVKLDEIPSYAGKCICGEVKDGECSIKNKNIWHIDAKDFTEEPSSTTPRPKIMNKV